MTTQPKTAGPSLRHTHDQTSLAGHGPVTRQASREARGIRATNSSRFQDWVIVASAVSAFLCVVLAQILEVLR